MEESSRGKSQRLVRSRTADLSFMTTSTLSSPDARKLIFAIAAILHNQIEADGGKENKTNSSFVVFDETTYLEGFPFIECSRELNSLIASCCVARALLEGTDEEKQLRHITSSTVDDIFGFISALYDTAQYSAECNVLALLYINRLIAFSGLTLHERNWRPVVFTSLLVAQKVWDDQLLSNASFARIYPFFTRDEMNRLEATFLDLLHFEVVVKPSTYAKYYFELRAVQDSLYRSLPSVSPDTADDIQERSQRFQQLAYQRFGDKSPLV
ncbi:hypothetical protein ACSSS7_005267 [Eimeria intestinalis]